MEEQTNYFKPNTEHVSPASAEKPSPANGVERRPVSERAPNPEQTSPGQPGMVIPSAQSHQPTPAIPSRPVKNGQGSVAMPDVADDVDVIEMEWVKKAKQLIQDTKDDPHAQEQAMEQLQIEYLRKRYGKEIKPTR